MIGGSTTKRCLRAAAIAAVLGIVLAAARGSAILGLSTAGLRGDLALAASPSADVLVLARTTGLYRSVDHGQSWQAVRPGAFVAVALAVVPAAIPTPGKGTSPPTFLASSQDGRVLRSGDGGVSWHGVPLPFAAQGPVPVAIEPASGDLLAAGDGGQWRREDATWRLISSAGEAPPLRALVVDPAAPEVLYGLSHQEALWCSHDGGASWDALSPGGPQPARALAVRRGGLEGAAAQYGCACGGAEVGNLTSIVYVLAGDALYRSFDRGETWYPLVTHGIRPGELATLAVDPVIPEVLYATLGTREGVMRSLDGGRVWRALDPDRP